MKHSDDDYDEERRTNLSACVAALSLEQEGCPEKVDSVLDESTYELMYNKATTLAAQGEYQKALTLLKKSEGNIHFLRYDYQGRFICIYVVMSMITMIIMSLSRS